MPKLAKLERQLAGKKKWSSNWRKAKAKITKLHSKITHIRKDFVPKASNDISKNHAVVFVEDLAVEASCARINACGEEGSGAGFVTSLKPASRKQESAMPHLGMD